ncbi:polyketide synthase [Pararhodospirillum photometricum]|uniref:polyketide synthase n=1 Tax=Pararhodospirillum photometricum TaxID=1084 RepID=UPI000686BB27|nr:polyketide synthase [Pararhodospirillum photometricum]
MSRVAIIGAQGRFPGGAPEPEAFFQQLMAGACWAGPVPPERWSAARFQATEKAAGKMVVEGGSFLDPDVQGFDPDVFGLAPEETACLDPQQRLLLEVAWEALERAALDPAALAGRPVGVYVGGFTTDHLLNQFAAPARGGLGRFSAVGSTLTMLANRLSHVFDLRGPSLTVDTACASSLSALALAVRDLEAGACSLALVGGASVMLRPEYPLAMAAAGLLARDGRCKPFSVRADGYGRGEGAAVLVLKPVAQASADGDRVWAVIEGVGQGHGGRTAGIALPHGAAQQEVMARVLAATGLDPSDIGYVEAHGTGTERGDAVEAAAIGAVYGRGRASALPIGSVKANIGHLEAAAGVAGVIKALGILQARCLPPHRLEGAPSPAIPFAALGLRLARAGEPLGASRVAVNAFGYGGSLVHVILGPGPPDSGTALGAAPLGEVLAGEVLVPLGAPSAPALAEGCERLARASTPPIR